MKSHINSSKVDLGDSAAFASNEGDRKSTPDCVSVVGKNLAIRHKSQTILRSGRFAPQQTGDSLQSILNLVASKYDGIFLGSRVRQSSVTDDEAMGRRTKEDESTATLNQSWSCFGKSLANFMTISRSK
jgi:hypothetical protein